MEDEEEGSGGKGQCGPNQAKGQAGGTFGSEEEAGIVFARARYKYPRTD